MKNISKVYRAHMIETHALRDFAIHVKEGEFVTVTGPSGSGKTSFLSIAGLLEESSSGEYLLDGVNVVVALGGGGKVEIVHLAAKQGFVQRPLGERDRVERLGGSRQGSRAGIHQRRGSRGARQGQKIASIHWAEHVRSSCN